MSGRKRHDFFGQSHQVFGLTGKKNAPAFIIPVIQGPDTQRIPRGNIAAGAAIEKHTGKFRIQHSKHFRSVLPVHRKQDFTVTAALKGVPFLHQRLLLRFKPIEFAVADGIASIQFKRLHARRRQAHNGKAVKTHKPPAGIHNAAVVRAA